VTAATPIEAFPALAALREVIHGFTGRVPAIDVQVDRQHALERLDRAHASARGALCLTERRFVSAGQVHGADVAAVDASTSTPVRATDGLLTADPAVCLGIYVADCGPVFLSSIRAGASSRCCTPGGKERNSGS